MRTAWVILLFGVLLSAYLYYVRGIGVQSQISAHLVLEREGHRRTYTWSQKAPMPSPRTEVTAAVLQGRVYVIGGFDGLARTVATVEIYDPATDRWRSAPDLPEGRHHAAAVTLGDTLYVIGGYSGMGFEPKADVFAFKGGAQWQRLAPLPEARGALAAAALGQKIFAIGGIGPQGLANDLFVYEPSQDSWITKTPAPTMGGEQPGATFSEVEAFDPASDCWLSLPPLPTPRHGLAAVAFENTLYAIGGGKRPGLSVSGANEALEIR